MSSKEHGILALQNEVIFPGNIVPLEIVSGESPEYELIDEAMEEEKPIVILTKKPDVSTTSPGINDLFKVGCKADIVQCAKKDGKITIFIEGFERVQLTSFSGNDPYETGTFETLDLEIKGSQEERELYETLKTEAKAIATSMPEIPKETPNRIDSFQDPVDLAYFLASSFNISMESRQDLLEINSLEVLLGALIDLTQGQVEISETNDRIEDNVDEMRRDTEREYYLRQRLKAIKKELGEEEDDVGELERRLNETPMPEEAEEAARKQFNRLQVMQPSSSEYSVVLNYVETLLDVPWFDYTDDNLDLDQAQATLDADHYGLDKVKDRIVEYLAVRSLKNDMKGPILCLVGPPGVGKAQPLYSKIMTPKGWVTMGDIQPGDEVIGSDGQPHKVVEVFPQGKKDIYRVHFNDGTYTDCCKDHLWATQTDLDRKAGRDFTVKSLDKIMKTLRYGKDNRKNHSIPMTAPVEFEEKDLPLDPYVMGALLGDGTLLKNGSAKFSNREQDITDRVKSNLPDEVKMLKESGNNVDYRLTIGKRPDTDENGYVTKNNLQNTLLEIGVAGCKSDEKFIPEIFLQGSVKQRTSILRGLMDTDGTVDKTGRRVEFSSTSKKLAENVQSLVHSLGGTTRFRTKDGWYKDSDGNRVDCKLCYRVTVSMPPEISPFWCDKKKSRHVAKTKYAPKRFIERVEKIGYEEAKCILIDSESHLYLTDDFIVTHNTSLGQSIARSLGRKFRRISLGGVHDESEIRGHRRTYVGALPGRIVKALNKTGTANPLLMLDEIDKMSKDFKGDPQAAMLEVLDPEQNHQFSDHYLEVPLDLSKVLFIATANSLDTISEPLKDRMEIIEVPSYTSYEKRQIAREFLIPKQIEEHGISESNINIEDGALRLLVDRYTKEAGVRALERRVADVCRSVAVEIAKTPSDERDDVSIDVDKEYVVEHLGPERFRSQVAQRTSTPGVATGLAWTRVGGDILFVETTTMSGEGQVKLTGQLGDVMKESAEAAFSYIKSRAADFGLDEEKIKQRDLHLHVPAGAIPKDGPSAGITIFSSILSIFTDTTVKKDLAMTGEITLRGNILPVGGIKEKLTAAHRAGIKEVVIPKLCEKDLVELNDEVKNELTIHLVERVEELPELVFDEDLPNVSVSALSEDDDLAETSA